MVDVEKFLISLRGHKDADGRLNPIYLDDSVKEESKIINEAVAYSKQWVGLTEWEREAIAVECGAMSADWLVFMQAVERALKEKNL